MRKRLTYIAPLKTAVILGSIHAALALICVPFAWIIATTGRKAVGPSPEALAVIYAVGIPMVYAIIGFLEGFIGAKIYNAFVCWFGGIEFEVRDV